MLSLMSPIENEAVQTLIAVFEAVKNKDHAKLLDLHSSRGYTLFNDAPPYQLLEGEMGVRLKLSLMNQVQDISYKIRDLHLSVYGDVAYAAYELEMSGILVYQYRFEGQRWIRKARCTTVMVREDGSWKIVHEHFSHMGV
ncbi:hypothetical protein HRbin02_00804 [Candidatus Calditenuaceae archaeon HR02]|nr:hypothetical protein HRbin02_00804 [Candidatus Calditenuaceae archaeon HR02]